MLAAFGAAEADVRRLPGGEEVSVVAGDVVLKEVQDPTLSRWSQALLANANPGPGFRIPEPIRSDEGHWDVDGWIATEFVDGLEPIRSDPARVVTIGEDFCDVATDAYDGDEESIQQRQDRWARADRFVWDEEAIDLTAEAGDIASTLRAHMAVNRDPIAVVHGDLSGNVFVDPSGVPVVLDFSPFIRPKRYASAIVVADNLLWYDGERTLTNLIDHDDDGLARALLFRMASEQLAPSPPYGAELDDYHRTLDSLGWA